MAYAVDTMQLLFKFQVGIPSIGKTLGKQRNLSGTENWNKDLGGGASSRVCDKFYRLSVNSGHSNKYIAIHSECDSDSDKKEIKTNKKELKAPQGTRVITKL